ncbi:hypothetical protein [Devosia sp. DBB001]|nr:hypothetical protein [Devosia sp. DBB001]
MPPNCCTAVGSATEARNALKAKSATPRHRISVTVAKRGVKISDQLLLPEESDIYEPMQLN